MSPVLFAAGILLIVLCVIGLILLKQNNDLEHSVKFLERMLEQRTAQLRKYAAIVEIYAAREKKNVKHKPYKEPKPDPSFVFLVRAAYSSGDYLTTQEFLDDLKCGR